MKWRGWLAGGFCVWLGWGTWVYLPLWEDITVMAPHVMETAPGNPRANDMMGCALRMLGRPAEEVIPYYERAVRSGAYEAGEHLASALVFCGRYAEGLAVAERLLAHGEGKGVPAGVWGARAMALLGLDRGREAVGAFREALVRMGDDVLMWQEMYRACMECGDAAGAWEALAGVRRCGGGDGAGGWEALLTLHTDMWARRGWVALAWTFFENNLRRRTEDLRLHQHAAWLLAVTRGAPAPAEEAVRLARRARQLGWAGDPRLLDIEGAALAAAGDFEGAIAAAEAALAGMEGAVCCSSWAFKREEVEKRLAGYRRGEAWKVYEAKGMGWASKEEILSRRHRGDGDGG